MKADFWHERWQQNQIGFHQDDINAHLETFWSSLSVTAESTVFVPLCGKSRDMLWLRQQGHKVLGIELSPIAVKDFFAENNLQAEITQQGKFERWECDGLAILVGDFFELTAADLQMCESVYDRASLIALPPEMRTDYAEHFHRIIAENVPVLLVTIEYEQSLVSGPPFSVSADEVERYYSDYYKVNLIEDIDALDTLPRFRSKGVNSLREKVWMLQATTDK